MKAKKENDSEFLRWFEEQAGKPIMTNQQLSKLMFKTIPDLRHALEQAEEDLAEANRYLTAKQYALYAWVAARTKQ